MNFTRRSWYLLAIAIPLFAWILSTAQLASRWDSVHDAKPIPLGAAFDAEGQSVAVFTDFRQPDREIICSVTRPKDQRGELSRPPVDVSVDYDSTRWHLVAMAEDGHEKMNLRCGPADKLTDGATYACAVVPSDFQVKTSAEYASRERRR